MAKQQPVHPVRDKYMRGLKAQRWASHNYWANAAFLRNEQWVHVNKITHRLEHVPDDPDRVRATINVMWPNSRTIMSKLTQRELQFEVPPNSADDVAIEGSRVAEAILEAVKDEHQWESLRESTGWSVWKGGTAAICVDWDPERGKPTALSDDARLLPSGDTVETALSLAEFVVQPGSREAERAYWWIKAQALPPEVVKATYNLDNIPLADATPGLSGLEGKLVAAQAMGQQGPGDIDAVPLTLVLTYYERPNPETPKGKVEVVVGGKSVWGPKEWPFPFVDYLNLATCRETVVENQWLGETVLTVARPVQVAFNAAWSNILEHSDIAGNARMLTPESALQLAEQFTDKIGEVVPYMDGMDKPSWLEPPQLAQWLLMMPKELRQEIDNIMGVHDISRGQSPANIESGYGLAVLAEQDATPIGKMAKSSALMWERVASMVLKLYEAEVDEKRTAVVKVTGAPPDTVQWSGKDIAGQTEAKVPLDLVLPRSRAAQMQLAEKALQMGMISTIEDFTRVAELPGERQLIEAVREDVARARRENHALAMGRVSLPEDWDDHAVHIAEHNRFRKSARYERLDDDIKNLFAEHIQAHETTAAEEAGEAQQRANMGGPTLAAVPRADGANVEPQPFEEEEVPAEDGITALDQLEGDPEAAGMREIAEASSMGAAEEQGQMERDAILALMETQGGA